MLKAQPTDPKVRTDEELALQLVFTDRLNQILDKKPGVIRSGRGRLNDFCMLFKVHYTTTHRIFHGQTLPNPLLLRDIADKFEVSIDWLLGRGESDVDAELSTSFVKIKWFDPRSNIANVDIELPIHLFTNDAVSSNLLVTETTTIDRSKQNIIVKITREPEDSSVHLIYDPLNDITYLSRIFIVPMSDSLFFANTITGSMEKIKKSSLVFGAPTTEMKLHVVGPVIFTLLKKFEH